MSGVAVLCEISAECECDQQVWTPLIAVLDTAQPSSTPKSCSETGGEGVYPGTGDVLGVGCFCVRSPGLRHGSEIEDCRCADGGFVLEGGASGLELTRCCLRRVLERFGDGVGGGGIFNSGY